MVGATLLDLQGQHLGQTPAEISKTKAAYILYGQIGALCLSALFLLRGDELMRGNAKTCQQAVGHGNLRLMGSTKC
jgi:hypothetical protein